jgi:hypothetical protein
MLGIALVAGSFASACTTADVSDDQPDVTQSALKTINATATSAGTATTTTTTTATTALTPIKVPVVAPPLVLAPEPPPPSTVAHPVCGKLVRIPSEELQSTLRFVLAGTRIVYDTTGTSEPHEGPLYHCVYPNQEAREQETAACMAGPPQDKGYCLAQIDEDYPNIKQCNWAIFAYHSYIDFGPVAELKGAEDMFFDVDTIVRDTWAGRVDIDINNVNTTVDHTTLDASFSKDPASDKAIGNLSLKLSSGQPTVVAHHFTGPYAVALTNMRVDAQLTAIGPTPDKKQLGFDKPLVTFHFNKDLVGIPDWYVEIFSDVESLIRNKVEKTLESALGKDKTRAAINEALTGLVENFAHAKIGAFNNAWFDGGNLMVDYSPDLGPAASSVGCTGATTAP